MKKLMKGNEAMAEAAVMAGCTHYFGYPITPQNEVPEYMSWRMAEVGGVFKQAESELAAISMVYGAASAGARAMTSSSGLGVSLMQECFSQICASEVPAVFLNVSRGAPGVGSIQPAQSDYRQMTKGGGTGDYNTIVYAPGNMQEAVDLIQLAFDKADEYRNLVGVYVDGSIGQMMESVEIKERKPNPDLPSKTWAAVGCRDKSKPRAVVSSVNLRPDDCENHNKKLQEKYKLIKEKEVMVEYMDTEDADIIIVAYGTSARIATAAKKMAAVEGVKVGIVRPITLWPFPEKELLEAAQNAKAVLCVEMSMGQMMEDVKLALLGTKNISGYFRAGGMLPVAREICKEVVKLYKEVE